MSFSTHFQIVETTLLPLPRPKEGQTQEDVVSHGLKVALSLIQNHGFLMGVSPLHQHFEEIPASADQAVPIEQLAPKFNVTLTPASSTAAVVAGTGGDASASPHAGTPPTVAGSEWRHYEVVERVPVMLGWKKDITFSTAIRNTATGMESITDPGSTVCIYGRYDVFRTRDDPSTLTLIERATTHCNLILGPYVKANLGGSHAEIHKTIKARFVEEMQKSSSPSTSSPPPPPSLTSSS